ncbi:MAG: hypothetical protein AAGD06_28665 [Acidobacteriota bacterium]
MNTHVSQLQQDSSRASANGSSVHQSVGQRSAVGTTGTTAVETLQRKFDASPGVQGGEQIQRSLNQSAAVAQRCGGGSRSTYQRSTEGVVQGDFLRSMRLATGMFGRVGAMSGQNLARSMAFSNMGPLGGQALGMGGLGTRGFAKKGGGNLPPLENDKDKYDPDQKNWRGKMMKGRRSNWMRTIRSKEYESVMEMIPQINTWSRENTPPVAATFYPPGSQKPYNAMANLKIPKDDAFKNAIGASGVDASQCYNLECAEVNALALAFLKGEELRGGKMIIINTGKPELRGTFAEPCGYMCENLLKRLDIDIINKPAS